eukprot:85369_1
MYTKDECKGSNVEHCIALQSVKQSMHKYPQIRNDATDINVSTQDLSQLLNNFLHLINLHYDSNEYEHIYQQFGGFCDISNCASFNRNHRDRNNNNKLTKLYNSNIINEILWIQMFDRIHCHYRHCFDIGHRLTSTEKNQLMQQDQTDIDIERNQYFENTNMKCLCKLLSTKITIPKLTARFQNKQIEYKKYSCGIKFKYDKDDGIKCDKYDNPLYVKPAYLNFKQELISNKFTKTVILTLQQFDVAYAKAKLHFASFYRK